MTTSGGEQRPVVHSVTTVAASAEDDTAARTRHYLVTMAIRTVCFLLMVVIDSWQRWIFAPLAIVLPWIAVVVANAVNPRVPGQLEPVPDQDRTQLRR